MADADATPSAAAGPHRRLDWLSLLAELPYFAIVILGLVGICWTSLFRTPTATYWVIVTPVAALLCMAVGLRRLPRGRGRIEMIAIQVGQWAAILVAMWLVQASDVRGLVTSDAMGRMMLTLLALGVFVAGLDLRAWRLCVAGVFLAIAVPVVAWFEQAALLLFLVGGVLIALGLLLWWSRARLSRDDR